MSMTATKHSSDNSKKNEKITKQQQQKIEKRVDASGQLQLSTLDFLTHPHYHTTTSFE